ncbi:MAG: prepilin-type N-terminal cleavage/methylation domain-containing protein [Phycisphaerales bacterium]|nr:prepilin-type N-terminal cleavage/methylation domain-containing protein [Phycisphaerales bacterium]
MTRPPAGRPTRPAARRGFTMVEMTICLAVLGIVLLAIVPTLRPQEPMKLVSAASMLTADLEYAQSASLATPSDPVVVCFEADGTGYWLARTSGPQTPITRPGSGSPFRVVFGEGLAGALSGVGALTLDRQPPEVRFDGFGRLPTPGDAVVRVSNVSGDLYLIVSSSTGSVSLSTTAPPPAPTAPGGGLTPGAPDDGGMMGIGGAYSLP